MCLMSEYRQQSSSGIWGMFLVSDGVRCLPLVLSQEAPPIAVLWLWFMSGETPFCHFRIAVLRVISLKEMTVLSSISNMRAARNKKQIQPASWLTKFSLLKRRQIYKHINL